MGLVFGLPCPVVAKILFTQFSENPPPSFAFNRILVIGFSKNPPFLMSPLSSFLFIDLITVLIGYKSPAVFVVFS